MFPAAFGAPKGDYLELTPFFSCRRCRASRKGAPAMELGLGQKGKNQGWGGSEAAWGSRTGTCTEKIRQALMSRAGSREPWGWAAAPEPWASVPPPPPQPQLLPGELSLEGACDTGWISD